MRNSGFVFGVVIGIAMLIVAVAASVGSRPASATPVHAGKTGKACGYCHVNPAGTGGLTAAGKRFQANGKL